MLGWFKRKRSTKKAECAVGGADGVVAPEEPAMAQPEAEVTVKESATVASPPTITPAPPSAADRPTTSPAIESATVKDVGLFARLRQGLSKTRESLVTRVDALFLGRKEIDPGLFDDLEEILITADLGVNTTRELLDTVRTRVKRQELNDPQALKEALQQNILSYLQRLDQARSAEMVMPKSGPFVIMVVGVNGVGKTTTIGKMAHKFVRSGQSVLLVAADTFRAAAVEQLKIWGQRAGVEVIAQQAGADPSSVVYDAMGYAKPRDIDVIIIDTAGRLHTKDNLMEELHKIKRVAGKQLDGAPHEILLVLDATTGQNAISQARMFHEKVNITGVALTKLDGTAKGGIVVNISHELNLPIRFIGIGEQVEDLRDFDANEFIKALFGTMPSTGTDSV